MERTCHDTRYRTAKKLVITKRRPSGNLVGTGIETRKRAAKEKEKLGRGLVGVSTVNL